MENLDPRAVRRRQVPNRRIGVLDEEHVAVQNVVTDRNALLAARRGRDVREDTRPPWTVYAGARVKRKGAGNRATAGSLAGRSCQRLAERGGALDLHVVHTREVQPIAARGMVAAAFARPAAS
jgi:hypothetical protein